MLRLTGLPLGEKSLHITDAYGRIGIDPLAVQLARVETDVAEDARERELFPDQLQRLAEPAESGQLHVTVSINVQGTTGNTVGRPVASTTGQEFVSQLRKTDTLGRRSEPLNLPALTSHPAGRNTVTIA